jgi:hypothetical protein
MNNYIVLFREPDGREEPHSAEEISRHRASWKLWFEEWTEKGRIAGGAGLSLDGRILFGNEDVIDGIHRNGKEIVGGFLLLRAGSLDEASGIMRGCPIFEFDGYAEVREMQG